MIKKSITLFLSTLLLTILSAAIVHAEEYADTKGVIGYNDMIQVLERLEQEGNGKVEVFTLDEYGIDDAFSEAGRDLYVAKIGNGDTVVWVQGRIHGNEPYGTNATLRLIEDMMKKDDAIHQALMNELTVYFIPMYNPDGAENNARGTTLIDRETGEPLLDSRGRPITVDLNRDWVESGFQARESLAFYKFWADIKPDYMIDLHHQGVPTYPESNIPVTMSLGISLAPGGPTLPNLKNGEYDVVTRQLAGYIYEELSKYKEYTVDRYRVGSGGTLEIDIHGGVVSAALMGLNYNGINPDNHSSPAVFLETSGQFLDGEREPLIEQKIIATRAFLFGIASGEAFNTDPDIWYQIPAPRLLGYNTDYSGTIQIDEQPAVLAKVSADEIKAIVERYDEIGRFSSPTNARQLKVFLESLGHYENSGNMSKLMEHLGGVHTLLDNQNNQGTITSGSYQVLKAYTDYWQNQLEKEAVAN